LLIRIDTLLRNKLNSCFLKSVKSLTISTLLVEEAVEIRRGNRSNGHKINDHNFFVVGAVFLFDIMV
jgi:hypothetical protein